MTIAQLQVAEQEAYKKYRESVTFENIVSKNLNTQREMGRLHGAYLAMHELLILELSKPIKF